MDAIELYGELRERFGQGESACLALASTRGWLLATDERKKGQRRFHATAEKYLGSGRILRTDDVYVLAIRAAVLTVEEADADKAVLEQHRFKMPFPSFRSLLGGR